MPTLAAPLVTVALLLALGPGGRADRLARAALAADPRDLARAPRWSAWAHAGAAVGAERAGVPAELLLALARVESRYKAGARSRGGRYCGALQATADPERGPRRRDGTGRTCRQLQALAVGYAAGAEHLARWLAVCRRRRGSARLRCALRGYGGVSVNGADTYPDRVLRARDAIRRELARLPCGGACDILPQGGTLRARGLGW